MNVMKRRAVLIFVGLALAISIIWGISFVLEKISTGGSGELYEKAEVVEISDKYGHDSNSVTAFSRQNVKAKILSGPYSGQIVETSNTMSGNPLVDVKLEVGSTIMMSVHSDGQKITGISIVGAYRVTNVATFMILAILLILIIGGFEGLKSLIIVVVSVLSFFKIMLPAIISGADPLVMLIITGTGLSVFIIFINNGFNMSSLVAWAGTISSCLFAAIVAYFFLDQASMSGFASIESRIGFYMEHYNFDMRMLLFSGLVISSLGAVTDLCLAVSRRMREKLKTQSDINMTVLFMEGIKAGRERMQGIITILCMAVCGVLIPWLAFYLAYSDSVRYILNSELAAGEILRLAGCYFSLSLALPLTALYGLAAHIMGHPDRTER